MPSSTRFWRDYPGTHAAHLPNSRAVLNHWRPHTARNFTVAYLGDSGADTQSAQILGFAARNSDLLVHLGILPESDRIAPPQPTRLLEVGGPDYYVYASENGVYEPLAEPGETVLAGQPAARLHFPETPWAEPVLLTFHRKGVVLCKRMPGRTMRGDCLFHLGTEIGPNGPYSG
ncbi:MAG: hypothetical protein J0H57_14850 [Rhodospirillales bacterium]|nr:hypothetical protein [Rhodospirillales bacterium]